MRLPAKGRQLTAATTREGDESDTSSTTLLAIVLISWAMLGIILKEKNYSFWTVQSVQPKNHTGKGVSPR